LNHGLGISLRAVFRDLLRFRDSRNRGTHPLGVPSGKSSYFQVGPSIVSRHRTPRVTSPGIRVNNGHSNGKGLDVRTREKEKRAKENGNDRNSAMKSSSRGLPFDPETGGARIQRDVSE